jgi:hypothetical protein
LRAVTVTVSVTREGAGLSSAKVCVGASTAQVPLNKQRIEIDHLMALRHGLWASPIGLFIVFSPFYLHLHAVIIPAVSIDTPWNGRLATAGVTT